MGGELVRREHRHAELEAIRHVMEQRQRMHVKLRYREPEHVVPWWNTRKAHIAEAVLAVGLSLLSVCTWIVMTVGGEWFVGGVAAAGFTVACLVRFSRGGGRGSGGRVTTTTTVRWK